MGLHIEEIERMRENKYKEMDLQELRILYNQRVSELGEFDLRNRILYMEMPKNKKDLIKCIISFDTDIDRQSEMIIDFYNKSNEKIK